MSFNSIGLPTDIPWERICYTTDMVHSPICKNTPPPQWRSSIAIFRYDVDPTLLTDPPLNNYAISYLRVDVTLAPWIQSAASDYVSQFVDLTKVAVDRFSNVHPCYGALLQVSVGAKGGGNDADVYFADFEPKKRELFEAVTSTGEVLSGSVGTLQVGKSTVNSHSLELSQSSSSGVAIGFPIGGGASAGASASTTSGITAQSGTTQQDTQQSDKSVERREVESHTTQLSQLYTLFQSYHVGTNRAMFMIEPRPHVLAGTPTFINGPRELEGIQSIFLVVVRPKTKDFCVNTHLDTVHLDVVESAAANSTKQKSWSGHFQIDDNGENTENWYPVTQNFTFSLSDYPDLAGWKIDVDKTQQALLSASGSNAERSDLDTAKIVSIDGSQITVALTGKYHIWYQHGRHFTGESVYFSLTVELIPSGKDIVQNMFIITRNLCCCDSTGSGDPCATQPSVGYENTLNYQDSNRQPWVPTIPPDQLTPTLISEMQKYMVSPRAYDPCSVAYQDSNTFLNSVLTVVQQTNSTGILSSSVTETTALSPSDRDMVVQNFGPISLTSIVRMDPMKLAFALNKPVRDILQLKAQILRMARPMPPPPLVTAPLRNVVGVRIGSTFPDPHNPKTLVTVSTPAQMYTVNLADQPNVIEVDFNDRPDSGTLTTSSFFVTKNGATVTSQLIQVTSTTARLILMDPFEPNAIYTITLLGTGSSGIKFGGRLLDGDAISLPSGDGVEGGNFTMVMQVAAPVAPSLVPILPPTLIKVIGLRVRSTVPNPGNPTTLVEVVDPLTSHILTYEKAPDTIEVDFNVPPDSGTLTTGTFLVSTDAGTVTATLTSVSGTTARLTITDPIQPGAKYTVKVIGTGSTCVKYSTRKLDGEALRFPSGDNIEGGDFVFSYKVSAAAVPAPPVVILARVIGMRIRTSVPDPMNPRTLHEVTAIGGSHIVSVVDLPDILEFDFNVIPDSGTVTTSSVTITGPSGPVSGTVTNVAGSKFRFKSASALGSGPYLIRLAGTGSTPVKFGGNNLDGEPLGLPSGNGIAGGDFALNFQVS